MEVADAVFAGRGVGELGEWRCLPVFGITSLSSELIELVRDSWRSLASLRNPKVNFLHATMEWFYEMKGQQAGPVTRAQLQGLLAASEIHATTLVWKQGMVDWAPLVEVLPELVPGGSAPVGLSLSKVNCPSCGTPVEVHELIATGIESKVCPHCRDDAAQSMESAVQSSAIGVGSTSRGTGGTSSASELRAQARAGLEGNWTSGAVSSFLLWLISVLLSALPFAGQLLNLVVTGPFTFGYQSLFLHAVRQEPVGVGKLFSGFGRFGSAFLLYVLVTIFVMFGMLIAAVPGGVLMAMAAQAVEWDTELAAQDPRFGIGMLLATGLGVFVGIYLSFRYALVYFVMHDAPDAGVLHCIQQSKYLMKGRKLKLLWLFLTFTGWHLLGLLCFGIGLLWSVPYMMAGFAAFYDDLGDSDLNG